MNGTENFERINRKPRGEFTTDAMVHVIARDALKQNRRNARRAATAARRALASEHAASLAE